MDEHGPCIADISPLNMVVFHRFCWIGWELVCPSIVSMILSKSNKTHRQKLGTVRERNASCFFLLGTWILWGMGDPVPKPLGFWNGFNGAERLNEPGLGIHAIAKSVPCQRQRFEKGCRFSSETRSYDWELIGVLTSCFCSGCSRLYSSSCHSSGSLLWF